MGVGHGDPSDCAVAGFAKTLAVPSSESQLEQVVVELRKAWLRNLMKCNLSVTQGRISFSSFHWFTEVH
ncbi:hypothetical protein AV530_010952 [Patagioenas fasciata monilis]|uniref:Uncharacterized protein n=1 Tax=Patagioenas fasciata monilis TaxID=372326 RepID=A0A1V4K8C8_PATFA|nr:hypothetical protein AV530_010952 [Patagioenas fasciata monilis]